MKFLPIFKNRKYHFLFFIFIAFSGFSQSNKIEGFESFNLPPKAVFVAKKYKKVDYSVNLSNPKINEPIDKKFLKNISEESLESIKDIDIDSYNYYKDLKGFYNSLSNNVKRKFTAEQLLYVYTYDQKLKNKLLTIK
jgi:hypothetical protein